MTKPYRPSMKRLLLRGLLAAACLCPPAHAAGLPETGDESGLVPFVFPGAVDTAGVRTICAFDNLALPDNVAVFATGGYSGRKTDYQIDQSGHAATRFDIVVNSPGKPVALILSAYEPSIWNIGWTRGTTISAVAASGYHRQAVAGLPKGTPLLNNSYDNRGPCGYVVIGENRLTELNPYSRKVFGRPVDMVYFARNGIATVGEPLKPGDPMVTSKETPPDSFIDRSKPLAGPEGLKDAVAKGLIRPSTEKDGEAWADRRAEKLPKDELPPVAGVDRKKALRPRSVFNGYVILKAFRLPAGLYGGNSATFFLPEGVPFPEGELGHSTLYDFNTMTCKGPGCRVD